MAGETAAVDTLCVLNPSATRHGASTQGLAPRPATLSGVTVGLVWNGKANGDLALRTVSQNLEQYGQSIVTRFYNGSIPCDKELLDEVAKECDVVVGCTADCGSCTSWMAHDCTQLERRGVPAMAIVSGGFEQNLQASARAFALPELEFVRVPMVYNNADANTVIEQTVNVVPELHRRLTGGVSQDADDEASFEHEMVEFPVSNPLDALRACNEYFAQRDWSDGHPVWPPVRDRVDDLLDGVGADPNETLFFLPPGNGEVTARKLATNCAMADCTPAEMSVVEAILRTFTDRDQETMIRTCLMSTSAHAPLLVVNGPAARHLGINGGRSCVGPGQQNEVNIRISRAVSLSLRNLGRWTPGVMDLDTIGTTRKHIVVIAENEDESPWPSFHVEYGHEAEENVVTLFFSVGEWDVGLQGHLDPEQLARAIGSFSGGNSGTGYFTALFSDSGSSPVGRLMLMAPAHAQALHEGGLTKKKVRDTLFETSKEPVSRLIEPIRKLYADGKVRPEWQWPFELSTAEQAQTFLPVIERPELYQIVVAGSARGKDLLMPTRCHPVSEKVRSDWLARTSTRAG